MPVFARRLPGHLVSGNRHCGHLPVEIFWAMGKGGQGFGHGWAGFEQGWAKDRKGCDRSGCGQGWAKQESGVTGLGACGLRRGVLVVIRASARFLPVIRANTV